MPLDHHIADEVVFTCESCGREQGLRALRRLGGKCQNCDAASWRLMTKYYEGPRNRETDEIIDIVTANVPSVDAFDIAKLGWSYKTGAFHYMEMRRELDAATERENQKARGARNCLRCGFFFMPAADKPWTSAGYCSKGCLGSLEGETDLPYLPVAPPAEVAPKQNNRTISLVCNNGHAFNLAAMYAGTIRPCPVCQRKTEVPAGI